MGINVVGVFLFKLTAMTTLPLVLLPLSNDVEV